MDIRFLVRMHETFNPTTQKMGMDCANHIIDVVQSHTSANDKCPIEGAITALYGAFMHFCEEAGYDPIGVAKVLLVKDARLPPIPMHDGGHA